MRTLRIVLWTLVALAAIAAGALYWRQQADRQPQQTEIGFGGPFTLVDSAGKPFPSSRLAGPA